MDHGSGTPDRVNAAARIEPAHLVWRGAQPYSVRYADIYHAADGPAEVRRVFIDPNRLADRFANLRQPVLRIGELGFGTALNFAVAAETFLAYASGARRLHFVTFEAHPLTHGNFAAMARMRCRDLPIYAELARRLPPLIPGWHRRHLAGGRIILSTFYGDAYAGLSDLVGRSCAPIDAWFLDGFAPDRNPELWSDPLFRRLAALSGDGTTLATFSSAGVVRRRLLAAGFAVERIDQRPFKRHTLRAEFRGNARIGPAVAGAVTVIGAGLSGSATARALADWGIAVRLVDRPAPSRNALYGTLLHPRLGNRGFHWRVRAFAHATAWLDGHAGIARSGALQIASQGFPLQRLEAVDAALRDTGLGIHHVEAATASGIVGTPLQRGALFFRDAATIDLTALCESLSCHPGIERGAIEDGLVEPRTKVWCLGPATREAPDTAWLELVPIAGQIDVLELNAKPLVPLIGDGFVAPVGAGCHAVGATYEHRPWDVQRASTFNETRLARFFTHVGLTQGIVRRHLPQRGVRAVTSDRLPIVSALPRRDGEHDWVNAGHGSSGTITAPLGAACIAAMLAGDFAPLTTDELSQFAADRFAARQRRRGLRHGASGP